MTFFWYDYETWGKNPHRDRIVQFGGLRTNEELEIIGEPIELKCQPGLDTLIGPGAVNVHGIMPMDAYHHGVPESEFAERIHNELSKEGTCSVAYNGMGFDHEFTRVLFYRNLRDPYEWAWKNGNTCWDMLELMRAAYLLQPDALKEWPKKDNGHPSFRLLDLASANLSDVKSIVPHDAKKDTLYMWELAKLIHGRAKILWDYALKLRYKKEVQQIVESSDPVLYTAGGKIHTKRHCSTFLTNMGIKRRKNKDFAFDLFYDPTPLLKPYEEWTSEDKSIAWNAVLSFKCNQSPFVCGWFEVENLLSPELSFEDVLDRIQLKEPDIFTRHEMVQEFLEQESYNPFEQYIKARETESRRYYSSRQADPDAALYDGFIDDPADRKLMNHVLEVLQEGGSYDWSTVQSKDARVEPLIFRYLARNYPKIRDGIGKERWEAYCRKRQLQDRERREVTADQIFSYELRDCTEPQGNLNDSQAEKLLKWQDRVRERLAGS